jgi:H+/Cl- antiporter ClcA
MILGMTAFFSAVVKAPVTGIILILEMSGNFNHLWSLVLVSLSAFVTADLIASRPIYAVLLERMAKPKLRNQESLAGNDDG